MTTTRSWRIGTRASPLAMWQARQVRDALAAAYPDDALELVELTTVGDQVRDRALSQIGGTGVFTKELEAALAEDRIDVAVHSLKDLPTALPDGLALACVLPRADARDALVGLALEALPQGACVGTSSLRRGAQLRAARPDLRIENVRGNVGTRLSKLDEGQYDALCLASAGLDRLELGARIAERLDPEIMVPAPGQGAVGLECRADDPRLEALRAIGCPTTWREISAERFVLHALHGGCQVPVGVHARIRGDEMHLLACVAALNGDCILRAASSGQAATPEQAARDALQQLHAQDVKALLERIRAEMG